MPSKPASTLAAPVIMIFACFSPQLISVSFSALLGGNKDFFLFHLHIPMTFWRGRKKPKLSQLMSHTPSHINYCVQTPRHVTNQLNSCWWFFHMPVSDWCCCHCDMTSCEPGHATYFEILKVFFFFCLPGNIGGLLQCQ